MKKEPTRRELYEIKLAHKRQVASASLHVLLNLGGMHVLLSQTLVE